MRSAAWKGLAMPRCQTDTYIIVTEGGQSISEICSVGFNVHSTYESPEFQSGAIEV